MRTQTQVAWAWGVLALFAAGCGVGGPPVKVVQREIAPIVDAPGDLLAGATEIDITPPPGLPSYGHGSNGRSETVGYWLRLKARVIVLEQGEHRIAMIQADLGASSALLHRMVATRLADLGLGPHNVMLATTHTHGGPGNFFGHGFYNRMVSAEGGYDPGLTKWLADEIAGGVRDVVTKGLRPARVGSTAVQVDPRASFNRSLEAWGANFTNAGTAAPADPVDRTLTLLRVDIDDGTGKYVPAATWSVFGVHGTTMPADYPALHGDVHGLAARLTAQWITQRENVSGFVAATAQGAEGDVGPGPMCSGHLSKQLTMRVARPIADAAFRAFVSLDDAMKDPGAGLAALEYAYRETSMAGANTSRGRLCLDPELGAPQAAGSELSGSDNGHGPVYGAFGMYEGSKGPARGCNGTKRRAGGAFQDVLFPESIFPDVVPFQLVSVGDLTLAAFPGEPTTEVGREVKRRIRGVTQKPLVAVVGLANGYATYFTMPDEYLEQHYEGGSTMYGPYQGVFAAEQLEHGARRLGRPAASMFPTAVVFHPGPQEYRFLRSEPCEPGSWLAGQVEREGRNVVFGYKGPSSAQSCVMPRVWIKCGGQPLRNANGFLQDDAGFSMEVRRSGSDAWEATWTPPLASASQCRFVVDRTGLPALESPEFSYP